MLCCRGAVPIGGACRYECQEETGAMLILREQAESEEVIHNNTWVRYMKQHHSKWCEFARRKELIVNESDIILVRGWVKTGGWTTAAFMHKGISMEFSFEASTMFGTKAGISITRSISHGHSVETNSGGSGVRLQSPPGSSVGEHHVPSTDPPDRKQEKYCVFIKSYKMKTRLLGIHRGIKAGAEPRDEFQDSPDQFPHELGVDPAGNEASPHCEVEVNPTQYNVIILPSQTTIWLIFYRCKHVLRKLSSGFSTKP